MRGFVITAWLCAILTGCGGALPSGRPSPEAQYAWNREASTTPQSERIVKIREFKLRAPQDATYSIIVGPDNNLWFTEYRAVVRMTTSGKMTVLRMRPTDSDPGFLTVGPDNVIWVTTAGSAPGSHFTDYQIMKVRSDLRLTVYDIEADEFPSNVVNLDNELYFGLDQFYEKSGSDFDDAFVATISSGGVVKTLFKAMGLSGYSYGWQNALVTPGPRIWLDSYDGPVVSCSLHGKCRFAYTPNLNEYVDNLHPDSFAYSPADNDVYLANGYWATIYKLSSEDKVVKRYVNGYIGTGYTALAYCDGNIWVTLGPDAKGRPMFGALTPAGELQYYALPLEKASYIATAMVCGPDHHLWYLRGPQVGEILSKV